MARTAEEEENKRAYKLN